MPKTQLRLVTTIICLAFLPFLSSSCTAEDVLLPPKPILTMDESALKNIAPNSEQIIVAKDATGVVISIVTGKDGYPGVNIKPDGAAWDLSKFGHLEARVTNTGEKSISVALRVNNAGDWKDNPWNTESVNVKPNETGTVSVIFGYAYGKKPNYKLIPRKLSIW